MLLLLCCCILAIRSSRCGAFIILLQPFHYDKYKNFLSTKLTSSLQHLLALVSELLFYHQLFQLNVNFWLMLNNMFIKRFLLKGAFHTLVTKYFTFSKANLFYCKVDVINEKISSLQKILKSGHKIHWPLLQVHNRILVNSV